MYRSYEKTSKFSLLQLHPAFHAGLRTAKNTEQITNKIGHAEKLERLEWAIEVNALVSSGLYRLATTKGENMSMGYVGDEGQARARETLKDFVRVWSEDGGREPFQASRAVLDALRRLEREVNGRRGERVLVPGAGPRRLAWEIPQLGLFFIVCMPS